VKLLKTEGFLKNKNHRDLVCWFPVDIKICFVLLC
jgi:hypothetical protein